MNDELLKAIGRLLDEKLEPIKKEIEEMKESPDNSLEHKILKDIDYMSGYYFNKTQ